MSLIQFTEVTPQQFLNAINESVKLQLENFKENIQIKEPIKFMSRQEVAEMLGIDLSTLWKYTRDKKLFSYGIGKRVFYKRNEVEQALVRLNK